MNLLKCLSLLDASSVNNSISTYIYIDNDRIDRDSLFPHRHSLAIILHYYFTTLLFILLQRKTIQTKPQLIHHPNSKMKCYILAIACLTTKAFASTASYSHASTSTWNPPRSRFGRRATDSRYKSTDAVIQWDVVKEEGPASEPSTLVESVVEETSTRIAPASARAAFVAIVSSAAICGARHAVELVLP
jgi:hypothetical protein